METGQLMNRIDNNIDSSDSTLPEESEVTTFKTFKRFEWFEKIRKHFQITSQNLTVQLGGTAFLVCKVPGVDRVGVNWVCQQILFNVCRSLFDLVFFCSVQNQISWIRRRDWHILSSGAQLYTNDERFGIIHTPGSNTWTLQIKFVQRRDNGLYECQASRIRRFFMFLSGCDIDKTKVLLINQGFSYSGILCQSIFPI